VFFWYQNFSNLNFTCQFDFDKLFLYGTCIEERNVFKQVRPSVFKPKLCGGVLDLKVVCGGVWWWFGCVSFLG